LRKIARINRTGVLKPIIEVESVSKTGACFARIRIGGQNLKSVC
jgi:hypothetical protein